MTDVDDFLGGGGAPSVSWKGAEVGTGYKDAKVVSVSVVQERKYPGGEPLFWDAKGKKTIEPTGQPVKQLEVTLHHPSWVGELDKDGRPNADGVKRDFFGGSRTNEKSKLGSLVAALKKAGASLEPGGGLSCQMTGGEATIDSPREFRSKYDKPAFDPAAEEEW